MTAASARMRRGGVRLQVVRDWVLCFNAEGPNGLIDRKAPGNPSKLNNSHRQALAEIVEQGSIPAIHSVVRWRFKDLAQWIWDEFRMSLAETTVSRELRAKRVPHFGISIDVTTCWRVAGLRQGIPFGGRPTGRVSRWPMLS